MLPVLEPGFGARAKLNAGLSLYDLLSFDRDWLDDPNQRLPGHTWLSARAALACEPCLDSLPARRRVPIFRTHQMYSPERARARMRCSTPPTTRCARPTHVEAITLLLRNNRIEGAKVADSQAGATFDIRANLTIVAAGLGLIFSCTGVGPHRAPAAALQGHSSHCPPVTRDHALTIATENSHFFVLPWRTGAILGTTDTVFEVIPTPSARPKRTSRNFCDSSTRTSGSPARPRPGSPRLCGVAAIGR